VETIKKKNEVEEKVENRETHLCGKKGGKGF
jgi:hypothetical protein